MKKFPPIGLVFATKTEAQPFIRGLRLQAVEKKPFPLYKEGNIFLIVSGIGKSSCAAATAYLIIRHDLSLLINLGSAGDAGGSYQVGDILHIREIIEMDRPALLKKGPVRWSPDIMDGFATAVLATQDRPVITPEERLDVSRLAQCVDMEGAAFVQTCRRFSRKAYIYKIISDRVGDPVPVIIKNIFKTRGRLFNFFRETIIPHLPQSIK